MSDRRRTQAIADAVVLEAIHNGEDVPVKRVVEALVRRIAHLGQMHVQVRTEVNLLHQDLEREKAVLGTHTARLKAVEKRLAAG